MSVEAAVIQLDFKNAGEMWLTEVILYICFILIWYLLIKILWHFCIKPSAPRFKQYNTRKLKPIQNAAEQSRRKRHSESPNTTSDISNTNRTRHESITLKKDSQKIQTQATDKQTPEEFQLQICKIHRTLRLCFATSLICTGINVTSIMLNHTLIISGAIDRNCITSRLPTISLLFQRLALYLFFIFRLHYSFGATQFGIKPIFIWILIVVIALTATFGCLYFFFVIVSASDPCQSGLAGKASIVPIGQDFFWNIFLSVLFLSRLGLAVKSQSRFAGASTRNLEKAQLKKARANYKYYYTMYKLTCLFITALIITVIGMILIIITKLAGAVSSIDSVASNYLLFLSFQFNDHYFRKIFCACLSLQACFLGSEYAREMELHFVVHALKKPHTMGSRTWQDDDIETTRKTTNQNDLTKIEEEQVNNGHTKNEIDVSENSSGSNINKDTQGTPTGDTNDTNDTNDKKVNIIITSSDNKNNIENDNKPILNKVNTIDSEIYDNELTATITNENNEPNTLKPATPLDDIDDNDMHESRQILNDVNIHSDEELP